MESQKEIQTNCTSGEVVEGEVKEETKEKTQVNNQQEITNSTMSDTATTTDGKHSHLTPQASIHEFTNMSTTLGEVQIEKTKNSAMWSNIVNNSLVGTGLCQRAAITNFEGSIYANSPGFLPTICQIMQLVEGMDKPSKLAVSGVQLGDMKFTYTGSEIGSSIVAKTEDHETTATIHKTKRCLMIVITDDKKDKDRPKDNEANNPIKELAEYLIEQGC